MEISEFFQGNSPETCKEMSLVLEIHIQEACLLEWHHQQSENSLCQGPLTEITN